MCSPETANTCIAPVAPKLFFVSWSKSDLSPMISALAMARLDPSNSFSRIRFKYFLIISSLWSTQFASLFCNRRISQSAK